MDQLLITSAFTVMTWVTGKARKVRILPLQVHLMFMIQTFFLLILILILGYLIPDQLLIFATQCKE
jgi:hypothetical protein